MKYEYSNNVLRFWGLLLLLTVGPVFIISLSSCGRRTDPVAISPPYEKAIEESADRNRGDEGGANKEEAAVQQPEEKVRPDAPSGLIAVYTNGAIVITWDEIMGQGVGFYRVYRSDGANYREIGKSVTPAFTDKNIEKKKEYYYRITAVGGYESEASKIIRVMTETN